MTKDLGPAESRDESPAQERSGGGGGTRDLSVRLYLVDACEPVPIAEHLDWALGLIQCPDQARATVIRSNPRRHAAVTVTPYRP
jgi:hypothetical protein